jgi:2-amino-4-hydroxy-6-hydroxymethyldihydropteridine diphosphokinase
VTSVLIALGSNLGDRALNLRRALWRLGDVVRIVRVSGVWETDPVDAPTGSGAFLNMAAAGWTRHSAPALLDRLHLIEESMGRQRRVRNQPRIIDLDLVLHGVTLIRSRALSVPHPRYLSRGFVLAPLSELGLNWSDPATGRLLPSGRGDYGGVSRVGPLY